MDYIPNDLKFNDLMSRWFSKKERNRYLFLFNYIATCICDKMLDENNQIREEVTLPSHWLIVLLRIINIQNKKKIEQLMKEYSKNEIKD